MANERMNDSVFDRNSKDLYNTAIGDRRIKSKTGYVNYLTAAGTAEIMDEFTGSAMVLPECYVTDFHYFVETAFAGDTITVAFGTSAATTSLLAATADSIAGTAGIHCGEPGGFATLDTAQAIGTVAIARAAEMFSASGTVVMTQTGIGSAGKAWATVEYVDIYS